MRPDDGGSSRPPLPEQAGPTERTLYDIYDFQTGIVDLTAGDWATSAESVRGLSDEVRGIVTALQGAPDAWTGPAAAAAYQSLGRLAASLDVHAEKIDHIEAGLKSAYDSVTTARTDYVTKVRSVSLDVDQGDYQRAPVRQPAQTSPDLPTVLDRPAYDRAVADARAAREQQAAAVLATFTDSMTTATKKLPVEPAEQTPVPGRLHRGDRRNGRYRWGRQEADGDPVHARRWWRWWWRRWWWWRPHSRPLDPAAHGRWRRLPGRHRRLPGAPTTRRSRGRARPVAAGRRPDAAGARRPGGRQHRRPVAAAAASDRCPARPAPAAPPDRWAPGARPPGWAGCSPVAAPRR